MHVPYFTAGRAYAGHDSRGKRSKRKLRTTSSYPPILCAGVLGLGCGGSFGS